MKKKTLFLSLVLISMIVLSGCGKKTKKNTIVGKWAHSSGYTYTFNEDKTCSYGIAGASMKCTYKVDGDKLSILYDGNTVSFDTTYSIDGDELNVKDSLGNDTIYKRK